MARRSALVVGGGIGGLAAGLALYRRGWDVEVLERSDRFSEIGAGLSLWPNALRALAELGLAEQVRAIGVAETAGGVRDRRGRWLSRFDNIDLERRYGWPLVVLHRADLLSVLLAALPSSSLRPRTEVHGLRADGPTVVASHRGGEARAEVVIGADGLRSDVRRLWWPHARGPRYAGHTAWRMVTDPLPASPANGAVTWGRGERFGFTSMPGNRVYCFATATAPAGGGSGDEPAEVRRRFGGWPDPIPELLEAVPADGVLRHDVFDLPPLESYVRGRVALLGDAAHAMTPSLGQGACQAIEDAVTIAACLDACQDVQVALDHYDRLRRPRTQSIVRRSARLGAIGQWAWPPVALARDAIARLTPQSATMRSMAPVLGWVPPMPTPAAGG